MPSLEDENNIRQLLLAGIKVKEISRQLNIGITAVYEVKSGYNNNENRLYVRGLSIDEKDLLSTIAKNKVTNGGRNKLLLSYIRQGIAAENPQNKIYLD